MKLIAFLSLILTGMSMGTHAQSLKNTSWRMFIDQLHDSLTIHIRSDSSFVTTSDGRAALAAQTLAPPDAEGIGTERLDKRGVKKARTWNCLGVE